jgi:hypothetical protein
MFKRAANSKKKAIPAWSALKAMASFLTQKSEIGVNPSVNKNVAVNGYDVSRTKNKMRDDVSESLIPY